MRGESKGQATTGGGERTAERGRGRGEGTGARQVEYARAQSLMWTLVLLKCSGASGHGTGSGELCSGGGANTGLGGAAGCSWGEIGIPPKGTRNEGTRKKIQGTIIIDNWSKPIDSASGTTQFLEEGTEKVLRKGKSPNHRTSSCARVP